MIDLATLQRWTEELGYCADPTTPSTLRIRPCEEGVVAFPPFYVQCAENWVVLSMFGVLDLSGIQHDAGGGGAPGPLAEDMGQLLDLLRRLLDANRDMRVAKFALDDRDEILLCAELPTESLDRSEFVDAVERIIEYATTYRHLLLGDGA